MWRSGPQLALRMIKLLLLGAVFATRAFMHPGGDISVQRLEFTSSSSAFVASRASCRRRLFPKRWRGAYDQVEPTPLSPTSTNTATVAYGREQPREMTLEGSRPGTFVDVGLAEVPRSAAVRAYLERKRAERRAEAGLGRYVCLRCHRPRKVCLCSVLPEDAIATSTQFLILQHPSEAKRQITGTVPLILLCLSNCRRVVMPHTGNAQFDDDSLRGLLGIDNREGDDISAPARPLLLFPCPDAEFLEDVASERHEQAAEALTMPPPAVVGGEIDGNSILRPTTLTPSGRRTERLGEDHGGGHQGASVCPPLVVLIDGTWSQARQILSRYPSLSSRKLSAVGPGARGVRTSVIFSAASRRSVDAAAAAAATTGGAPRREETTEDGLCRAVMFRSAGSSGYGFRREPSRECISTLESVAYTLEVLEPTQEGLSAAGYLRRAFSTMVSTQLEARGDAKIPRFEGRKARAGYRRSIDAANCSARESGRDR